ncbi:hypothetical protein [Photobacterium damselae]|uniref:hypothetical protein n=1 Tax=Photobacterium damselae TaxID=38293 RepID=UPI001F33E574|nr:hypothetical protein [Photobacterium damselae]UKA04897.1 hypothetical protein IHC89_21880 [Photobacterium damselae subsp. damselae]
MTIKFPKTVDELKSALKKAIESYSKNPATNNNKLNEATAAALNCPNYDTLAGIMKKQSSKLQSKQQAFIGTFNVPPLVAQYLSEYNEDLDFDYEELSGDLIESVDEWLSDELNICYKATAVVVDDTPSYRSCSLFTDVEGVCDSKTVQINLFGDRTNIGFIKFVYSTTQSDEQQTFLQRCYKCIQSINYNDLSNQEVRDEYLSSLDTENISIKSLCQWLSSVSPTYQATLRVWLEDSQQY